MLSCVELVDGVLHEMGDPDELAEAQDLIVLQLDEALPAKCRVPQKLKLDTAARTLTTNRGGFSGCRGFLRKHCFPVVVFAGLPDLTSNESFLDAAREVLWQTRTLIIVHNRNRITDLGGWFPTVEILFLPHDLKMQLEEQTRLQEVDMSPNLMEVYGTTPAVGCDKLTTSAMTLVILLCNCPLLSQVQAPLHELMLMAPLFEERVSMISDRPILSDCRELVLGLHVWRRDGNASMLSDATAECVTKAVQRYPKLRQLQLTTRSKEALAHITEFKELRRLTVMYCGEDQPCPFEPHMTTVLRALSSSLTHLTLSYFDDASLITLGRTCRNLQGLVLRGTHLIEEDEIPSDLFPKLTSLSMDGLMPIETFYGVLRAVPMLTDLCLEGDGICAAFLAGPLRVHWLPLMRLRKLTLGTGQPLVDLRILPEEVRIMFKLLPSLERLRTDSYDIRLYVQNFCPKLKLAWTTCTTCAAEFPMVDDEQEKVWRMIHKEFAPGELTCNTAVHFGSA